MNRPIPLNIIRDTKVLSLCVGNWFQPNLGTLVNDALPKGWTFVKHTIRERDSFGPVTSTLVLRGPNGKLYEELI